MFMGEFNHTIDTKGRVIVPSRFREQLGEEFVVTKGLDHVLYIYDMPEWEKLCEKLKEEGILTRHFADKKLDKYLRITIGTEQEMAVVLIAIKEILAEVKV